MGLLDRLRGRGGRRTTAVVVDADPGPADAAAWPAGLLLLLDGELRPASGQMTRELWLVPGERVPVCVMPDGAVDVDWEGLAPLAERALAGGRPFCDPATAADEIAAALAGAPLPDDGGGGPAPHPVPGLPEVLPDGRLRGEVRVLAASRPGEDGTAPWLAVSVAVPGHPCWGVVVRARPGDGAKEGDVLPAGVRPGDAHDVVVLWDEGDRPPAGRRSTTGRWTGGDGEDVDLTGLMAEQLEQLRALRASGALPPAVADQMEAALRAQLNGH